ncbi:MAG: hypothetical protein ACI4QI_02700 [Candidatus Coproplasma sp.]
MADEKHTLRLEGQHNMQPQSDGLFASGNEEYNVVIVPDDELAEISGRLLEQAGLGLFPH